MERVKPDRNAFVHLYLFGLFALGLVLSQFLVSSRSGIRLSKPIRLSGQGLAVSLPTGPGWQSLDGWKYERDNSYALLGQYATDQYTRAEVRWQYLLAAEPRNPEQLLQEQLDRLSMPYQQIAHLSNDVDFVWSAVYPQEGQEEAAMGLTVLEPGRVLLLQVRAQNQPLMAETMFQSLARSVRYRATEAVKAGQQLAEAAGRMDPTAALEMVNQSFLISDPSGRKIGYFRTRSQASDASDSTWKLQLETNFFVQPGRAVEQYQEQLFVDPFLSNLDWNCIYQARSRQAQQYRLARQEDGSILMETTGGSRRVVWPAAVTLPDTLVPMAAALLLDSDFESALVDVVSCRGEVVPTRLTKVSIDAAKAKAEDLYAAVRVDYLHREDNYEELYFDADNRMIGKLEVMPGPRVRIWDRATEEEILFQFGNLFQTPGQSAFAPASAERTGSF